MRQLKLFRRELQLDMHEWYDQFLHASFRPTPVGYPESEGIGSGVYIGPKDELQRTFPGTAYGSLQSIRHVSLYDIFTLGVLLDRRPDCWRICEQRNLDEQFNP